MILPSTIDRYHNIDQPGESDSEGLSSSSDVHTHVLERRQELRLDNHCLSSVLLQQSPLGLGPDPPLS